jgi:hypothetical protein
MIKFKPESLNDTTRRFPRTLRDAFPFAPEWHDRTPLADRVVIYLGCFVAGYICALVAMGY